MFLETWNGVSLLRMFQPASPTVQFVSDASGSFGCGAVWLEAWLQVQWPRDYRSCVTMRGRGRASNSGYSREPHLMHMLRCLFFIRVAFGISLRAVHSQASSMIWQMRFCEITYLIFFLRFRDHSVDGSQYLVPFCTQPDCTSPRWARLFRSSLQRV